MDPSIRYYVAQKFNFNSFYHVYFTVMTTNEKKTGRDDVDTESEGEAISGDGGMEE